MNKVSGIAIAAAAAAIFSTGAVMAPPVLAADSGVKCAGVNSCKGATECKTATNDCKGLNSCKGQGWVHKASAAECEKKGGKVVTEKM